MILKLVLHVFVEDDWCQALGEGHGSECEREILALW